MLSIEHFSIVIQTIMFLGGGAYFIWSIKASVAVVVSEQVAIKERLIKMDSTIERLSTAAVELARQDERLNHIDHRMQELSTKVDGCYHKVPKVSAKRRS